jgi:hypothetical protein
VNYSRKLHWFHGLVILLVMCLGMQLQQCQQCSDILQKSDMTYYAGSISSRPGWPKRLKPAMPKHKWKTSTMSPGLSEMPPSSGS